MPRQARLDCPGTLHHVMLRGLARGAIVTDDKDRENLLSRLGEIATATGTAIYAWAILPNHLHLLCRSGPPGLPLFMRRWLTGYALRYNRRHRRIGHLFQNRYKSIVVEEDAYFQELVRYIHLNPLRANLVHSLRALDRYPLVRACHPAGSPGGALARSTRGPGLVWPPRSPCAPGLPGLRGSRDPPRPPPRLGGGRAGSIPGRMGRRPGDAPPETGGAG